MSDFGTNDIPDRVLSDLNAPITGCGPLTFISPGVAVPNIDWQARALIMRGRVRELERRNESLERMLMELRREGFAPPPKIDAPAPTADDIPDKVTAAIRERAHPNSPLWRDMIIHARTLTAAGVSPEEAAKRILVGMPDPDALLE
jgi:hypothetical protein